MVQAAENAASTTVAAGSWPASQVVPYVSVMAFVARPSDEELNIRLSDGVEIWGLLRRHAGTPPRQAPDSQTLHPPGLIVFVHGRLHRAQVGPCAQLAESDVLPFDVCIFDMRGCGRSTGETGYANAPQEAEDVHQILQYLEARGELVIAVCGHSKGAVAAIMLAGRFPDTPRLLVSLSARYSAEGHDFAARWTDEQRRALEEEGKFTWLNYRVGKDGQQRKPYVITKEAVEQYKGNTLGDFIPSISKSCHVLTIHGRSDGTVKDWNATRINDELKAAGVASDLFLLDGCAHNYDSPGEITLIGGLMASWLQSRIAMPPVDSGRKLVDHLNRNAVQAEAQKQT